MDNRWAAIWGVLALGAGLWWYTGHPGFDTPAQKRAKLAALEQRDQEATQGHLLYRCRGADGVNMLTDRPPPGRKCTEVRIRDDQNVVSLGGNEMTAEELEAERAKRKQR
jgi:hypothetical protein